MRHVACRVSDLSPGGKVVATVGRRRVVVCRSAKGEYYAVSNTCPHEGANLGDGRLEGTTYSSSPGQYRYGREGEILRCPWHQFEFDVTTGESVFGERDLRVKTYPVVIEDGYVLVEDGAQPC